MANAKKCDRCGKFYDFYEGVEFINNCCSKYVGVEYIFYDYLFAKYLQNPTSEAVLNSILADAMEKGY